MSTYDFVIVGAGPAGCTIAERLANSKKRPTVLLVEAGASKDSPDLRIDGERWLTMMNEHLNYRYTTAPQEGLDGRVIGYDRGKGLGGSSAINFSVYNVGAKDDFDEIAAITKDPDWKWEAVQNRFKQLESWHGDEAPETFKKYFKANSSDHGSQGKLHIGFPSNWERSLASSLDVCESAGLPLNPDVNSGNPIGVGVCPSSAYRGWRSTAADLVKDGPDNLKILTETVVAQILVEDNVAKSIKTINGETITASKELILCAGSVDTPKILMLSGIGPAEHLSERNIPVIQDLPVGHNLKDHSHVYMIWNKKEGTSDRPLHYRDPESILKAKEQWKFDGTGPLAELGVCLGVGYLKRPKLYETPEFHALPSNIQSYLTRPTVPAVEILVNAPDLRDLISPSTSLPSATFFSFLLNPQSTGTISLPPNPTPLSAPISSPNFLSHPYDRRIAIESIRQVLELVAHPDLAKDIVEKVDAPDSASDEDILKFWKAKAGSTWHMTGTCQIDNERLTKDGKTGVLDKDFKVKGLKGLRVGDLSAVPLLVK
ncbi:putative glucose-methanol-choline oxidoreductase [Phaeomoniella chlamydospora]|uniref:Putative glucose-methanol-choline oxidoreductase n=1 Tax=Phaeomoniella chlamydospora TaxID=158046 RepID=A0A0G2F3L0_PHACM|nr:putative glucose-methanol-choline oxidoreductase [Phaeomoniella chlamydospora]